MKTKHAILIIALGYCFDFIGAVMKITHKPGADNLLLAAAVIKVVGVLILAYKITSYPRLKDLMNW